MHKPSNLKDYVVAVSVAIVLFVILGCYLYVRRGYLMDAPASAGAFYVPNKIIAGVAVTILAFVFLIGPIVRYFDKFDHFLSYRKELGIVGGFLAIAHGIISSWFVPAKFNVDELFEPGRYLSALAGLAGALFLAILIVLSLKSVIDKLGGSRWWFLQRWGMRFVILMSLLHVIPMKWAGWVRWFQEGGRQTPELLSPWMAPAGILVTLFLVWVILIRVYESVFLFRDFGIKTKEISMDPVLKARGRKFFLFTFWILIASLVVVLTRHIS